MSFWDDAQKFARVVEPLVGFVALAQHATGLGGDKASEALEMIRAGLQVLEDASAIDKPADVLAKLEAIKAGIAADRADEDKALDERFGRVEP